MTTVRATLKQASAALKSNNAEALETLCAELAASAQSIPLDERHALRTSILVFKRQVLAAQQNLVLRERLLTARITEIAPWAP